MNKTHKTKCKWCPNYYWVGNQEHKTTFHCKLRPQYFIDRFTKQPKWCPLKTDALKEE